MFHEFIPNILFAGVPPDNPLTRIGGPLVYAMQHYKIKVLEVCVDLNAFKYFLAFSVIIS